ncbi:MAG: rhodanese-like domain-containing protein [Oscillospiraceae bacterium]|nr:rhodanese-like domain-containing protein [Oscillospiraceae bacterium]
MQQFFLVAAVICFGMAAIKFLTARMTPNHAPARREAPPEKAPGRRVLSPEEAKRRMEENPALLLLDVRTQEEYDGGHIPGAVCLPNEEITADMPVVFDKDTEILLYCHSGRRSAEALEKLEKMGYTNVSDLGGIAGWPYETTTD